MLNTIFPFLRWFKGYNLRLFRVDLISGLTVALVLIPQSMAYAQLANLPAYYGLYAAFLPPVIASLFGSSNQLATGPVAIVSLMTSTALAPLATAGGEAYIAYAIVLALLVGIFQFSLGILRLGLIVNFLSHPVVNGFTNAAALIIATSQLSKLFGVTVEAAEHHYETVYRVVVAAIHGTHLPTLGLAVLAFGTMYILRQIDRRIPSVLIAVVLTTLISWLTGYENNLTLTTQSIRNTEILHHIEDYNHVCAEIDSTMQLRVQYGAELADAKTKSGAKSLEMIHLENLISVADLEIDQFKENRLHSKVKLHDLKLLVSKNEPFEVHLADQVQDPTHFQDPIWHLKIGNGKLDEDKLILMGGGAVVGQIPRGVPSISLPKVSLKLILDLFPMAIVISLLGFMEAISIAKAIAVRTGQRLDPNQELIGQGLSNMVGSCFSSYPVSGSFSRSAVNIQAGAVTGISNAISSAVVLIILLFMTPLLYHLPQAALAAIIMMAVIGLLNVKGFIHAWQAQPHDGIIAVVTFVTTLVFAPHLDKGIMIGVVLSVGHFLIRNTKPDMALLSKYVDGTYRNADRRRLKKCEHIAVVRYSSSLFFANVSYLEDEILELVDSMPELKHVHIVSNGINELDASGEETLSMLVDRLRENSYDVSFSGLNESVLDVMHRTHLFEKIGEDHIYGNVALALFTIYEKTHRNSKEEKCSACQWLRKCRAD
ncbi:SulP family inorganic anion transporter [Calditrichota bacterium]